MVEQHFVYDVYLSASSADKKAAASLGRRLKNSGLKVWFEDREIQPGHRSSQMRAALEQSRALILMTSAKVLADEWQFLERQTALFRDSNSTTRRFIPVILDKSDPPPTLKQFAFIRWRRYSSKAYTKILTACQPLERRDSSEEEHFAAPSPIRSLPMRQELLWSLCLDGAASLAIIGSDNGGIRAWNLIDGTLKLFPSYHSAGVSALYITPDAKLAVSGSHDGTVRTWSVADASEVNVLEAGGIITAVALSSAQDRIASCSSDGSINIWNSKTEECIATLDLPAAVSAAAFVDDGRRLLFTSDREVILWDISGDASLLRFSGHTDDARGLAISSDGRIAVSASDDTTLRVWDVRGGRCTATLEGHTGRVRRVAMTPDARLAVSASSDRTLRIWDLRRLTCIGILNAHASAVSEVSVTSDGLRAVSGSHDGMVRFWDLSQYWTEATAPPLAVQYTSAKVLLVGETGVGKSGIALRLTANRFEPTISSDAVWATQLQMAHEHSETVEREIWLWDFAGQSDYRLIHQLFMDETALAVLVFNPQSDAPFEGLSKWERDISRAARRSFRKLLVAGRCDRGGLMVSRRTIEEFCRDRGFAEYIETSALTGKGCAALRQSIITGIPWNEIPWTTSPLTFKLLKDAIIMLKDEGRALMRLSELKQQLEVRLSPQIFSMNELRAAIGLLAGPGIVWQLCFGDFILLQPERINSYASAVIRSVRAHQDEIGCIYEQDILSGNLQFDALKRLSRDEEEVVLRAMHQTFIDYGLCLREYTDRGPLLVFPSYYRRERPELEEEARFPLVTYRFCTSLDEVYATLVVRLHHTNAFSRDQLWNRAADFRTQGGKRITVKVSEEGIGRGSLKLYFDNGIPDDTKVTFIRYVHAHLKMRDPALMRTRDYQCASCGTQVEQRTVVQDRLKRGLKDIVCVNCEARIPLWDLIEEKFASSEVQNRIRQLNTESQKGIDNESRELILIGHAFAIAGEAGQIFRPTPNSDWGIDGEIEFKDYQGKASGKRVYLQLKSGDSYLQSRARDGAEVFRIKNPRHSQYWQEQAYTVMLVIRTSDGIIRWMDVTSYLRTQAESRNQSTRSIIFRGEPFSALNLQRVRDRLVAPPSRTRTSEQSSTTSAGSG